jgi:hypothetical protein
MASELAARLGLVDWDCFGLCLSGPVDEAMFVAARWLVRHYPGAS